MYVLGLVIPVSADRERRETAGDHSAGIERDFARRALGRG